MPGSRTRKKNWKFEEGDVTERGYWKEYQQAYEDVVNETAADNAPWYVIPADDKKNLRLLVGRVLIDELKKLPIKEPEPDDKRFKALQKLIAVIREQ